MKRALHLLGTRILRSRVGVALVLAVLVLGIVTGARVLSGPAETVTTYLPAPPLVASPTPHEDGLLSPNATVSPTLVPDAEPPEAVASAFAAAWVDHEGVSAKEWHSRLARNATAGLARKLSGVDPAGVPADRITGRPAVIPHAATIVDVVIPVDSGRLRLRLIVVDDRWVVDGVDWERA